MVAQVAADDPDTEPKIPQPSMVVCISRPGILLSQGERPSNISSESLVRKRISPIQMNIGSAASEQQHHDDEQQTGDLDQLHLLQVLAEIAARMALFGGGHVGRPLSTQHQHQLVHNGDKEEQGAYDEARLRDPQRNGDQAVGHVVELPALVGEAEGPEGEVADCAGGDGKRGDLECVPSARAEVLQEQRDAHEIAPAEGMRHGEERRGGAEPGHQVVAAAGAQSQLAHDGAAYHHGEDRKNKKRREGAPGVVEEVEELAHYILRYASTTAYPSGPAFFSQSCSMVSPTFFKSAASWALGLRTAIPLMRN